MSNETMQSYQNLVVWQKAMDLVIAVYSLTLQFPESEKYGLIAQMRRSAVSIPSNIAEGKRRGSQKDFRRFLLIAFGSGAELETQLAIAQRLSYRRKLDYAKVDNLLPEVMKMLNVLIGKLTDK